MARTHFENLHVYQLAEQLSDLVWGVTVRWDRFTRETIGKQLVRSCDSVGANIAEGVGRGTFKDNCRFIYIARGSLYETKHWLRRAYARRLLSSDDTDRLRSILNVLTPMLNAYLKSIGNGSSTRVTRVPNERTTNN